MRILLVEDNLDLGDAVESKLRLAGHSVQWARDGLTALRRGLDETWDALVLDINLPGKDGFRSSANCARPDWRRRCWS